MRVGEKPWTKDKNQNNVFHKTGDPHGIITVLIVRSESSGGRVFARTGTDGFHREKAAAMHGKRAVGLRRAYSPQVPEAVHVVAALAVAAAVLFARAQSRFAYGRGRGADVE